MQKLKIAHETFSIERIYNSTPEAVYSAWSSSESKANWFFGPRDWILLKREMDFRVGGREILHGRFGDSLETLYTAQFHNLIPNQRIVFAYDMHMNNNIHSVSLASVEIEGIESRKTQLTFTEQVAFLDGTLGKDGATSRKEGTIALLDKLVEYLKKRRRSHVMKFSGYLNCTVILFFIAACASRGPVSFGANDTDVASKPYENGYAPINGIEIYYEIHGKSEGVPLVLLNGGGSTIDVTFSKVLPIFAKYRKVIALEEQGHGRTTDRNLPFRFETSADDVAALLKYLKVEKADLFGFSNGASVALQMSIRHPKIVRKLVFASSMTKKTGAYPQFWNFMKEATFASMPQALKDAFIKVNPDPQKLRNMYDKDVERMLHFKDVRDAEIRSVQVPTLILIGDKDLPKPEHAIDLVRLIPDARLLILPGGHGDYLGEAIMYQKRSRYPEITATLIEEFLGPPE